jgi:membrane-associated protease RseP (regulator of RpoE activity)
VAAAASDEHVDHFVVDTGATGTVTLVDEQFQALVSSKRIKPLGNGLMQTAAGTGSNRRGRVQLVGVRDCFVFDPIVRTASEQVLGLGYWSRFIVTFDFPNRIVYLKRGSRFSERDRIGLSGLHLLRIDGRTVVHSVEDNSPAASVGIRANDQIIRIANKEANELSMFTIREMLRQENEELCVTLSRNSQTFDCSLRLLGH